MIAKYFPVSLVLLFALSSCQPLFKLVLGVKDIKPIGNESTFKKANKLGIDTCFNYYIRSEIFIDAWGYIGSFNEMEVYDRYGYKYYDTEETMGCNINKGDYLSNPSEYAVPDSTFFLLEYMVVDAYGNPLQIEHLPEADLYMVIYWGVFVGRVGNNTVKKWHEAIEDNSQLKIQPIYICIDPYAPLSDDWENIIDTLKNPEKRLEATTIP